MLYSFCSQPHCADGDQPEGGLIKDADGLFYGMTAFGGNNLNCHLNNGSCGTIFSLNAKTGVETVLHTFPGGRKGEIPTGWLATDDSGDLYGTTEFGGNMKKCPYADGCGFVFALKK